MAVFAARHLLSGPASNLTTQQRQAVLCRDVSVVLSSGAGCGKTHVLTERYLSHLRQDGVEVGQLVAITFTDRAARQMRRRIRQALTLELHAAIGDDEAERWARHLRGLETALICTIHSFCGNILRQHSVEAGLDPRFDVLEDVLSRNLESQALTDCLQRLLTADSPAGEDLRQLVLIFGWKPTVETIEHLVGSEDVRAWDNWLHAPPEKIASDWMKLVRQQLLPRYVQHLVTANPKIAGCLKLLTAIKPHSGSKMVGNVHRLLEETPRLAEAANLAAAIEELTEAAKVGGERGKAWPSEEAYEAIKAAFEDFRKELPNKLEGLTASAEDLADAAVVGQRLLRVASEAAQTYRQLKRRTGVVDFQDLLVFARDLLRDQPAVRERLQGRYRFLLIDELQDTDPVQIEFVNHLCGAGLTQGKLFAVGDQKQSIYRFRGADVHRFQALRQQVPHEGRLELTTNFRSQPAILNFVNVLLGGRMADYEPLVPHLPQLNPQACIEFLWSKPNDKDSATEVRMLEADAIARRIAAMIQGEFLVVDKDQKTLRRVCQGDVVLLFRSMTHVQLYEAALRKHGLDYYLVGGRAFFAQQEIYDLLNLLRTLENPQDGVSLAGTLRSPFCCLSDEALFHLSRHPDGLWAGLHDEAIRESLPADEGETGRRALRFLERWRGLKDRLPIARLLAEVFADSGYDAATQLEFLGDRKLANLWKLVDLARTFDRSGLFGLAEFIQRLGDLVRTQPREEQAATQPESADVVRLMTIHQAKGLEFPVVFVLDMAATGSGPRYPVANWDAGLGCVVRPPDEEPLPFSKFGWQMWKAAEEIEDWNESLRTLYVACTRAQDYLVLSGALKEAYMPANAWMVTLAERFDLWTGACRAADIPMEQIPKVVLGGTPAEDSERAEAPAAASTPVEDSGRATHSYSPLAVKPIPVRLSGKVCFTVAEIESLLRWREEGPKRTVLQPADVALQFTTEDGADRSAWVLPRDRLTCKDETSNRLPNEPVPDPVGAKNCFRDLEFILDWPLRLEGASDLFSPAFDEAAAKILVRGMMDCLWQDNAGDWHLLAFVAEQVPPAKRKEFWQRREPGLALACWAVQRMQGSWPKTVALHFLADNATSHRNGRQLQRPEILRDIEAALTDILARHLSLES